MLKSNLQKGIFTVLIGIVIWFLPIPEGLTPQAWHMFAIFVATIVGFILHPLPIGAIALTAVGLSGFLKVIKPAEALAGYGNATIWLIVSAFLFAKGFMKTGLGARIAYKIMAAIGNSTLKLGYTLALTDFIVSPATPSNTARGGGIIFPVVRSLCSAFKSEPGESAKKIGSYLMNASFQCDCITSSMFLTSVAPNSLCAALALQAAGVELSWGTFALACAVPGFLALMICPYLVYKLDPPEIKKTPEAKEMAEDELRRMGPMSDAEKTVLFVFFLALLLWATSQWTKLNATMIALVCVGIMLIRHAIEWSDVTQNSGAWDTLVWMGGLMGLATALNKVGLIKWMSGLVANSMGGMDWLTTLLILLVFYMYSHYAFASLAAHVGAMYAAFLSVAIAAGAPPVFAAIAFASLTGIMGGLTHYATGPAPIFFGAGFVSQGKWWTVGFVMSIINVLCFVGFGSIWWKVIGLY